MLPRRRIAEAHEHFAEFAFALREHLDLIQRDGGFLGGEFGGVDLVVAKIFFAQAVLLEADQAIAGRRARG